MINLSAALQALLSLHALIPRLLWRDGRAFLPIHLLIEVTYRCNLRCNFCQYLDIIEGRQAPAGPVIGDLPADAIRQRVDELPRGRLITFTGGDVTVRKDFLDLLAHASRRHRTHIISNGALITEQWARRLVDLAPRHVWQSGLVLVDISLEGMEERHDAIVGRHGSWRRSVDAVRRIVGLRREAGKSFPKLNLKIVVTRDTVGELVEFTRLAAELGADVVNIMAEHDLVGHSAGGDRSRLRQMQRKPQGVDPAFLRQQLIRCFELERELRLQLRLTPYVPIDEFVRHYTEDRRLDPTKYVCEAGWARMAIGAAGVYSPMCHFVRTADMRRQSLAEAWNSAPLRTFRQEVLRDRIYPGCSGCCNLKYVGGKRYGLAGIERPRGTSPPLALADHREDSAGRWRQSSLGLDDAQPLVGGDVGEDLGGPARPADLDTVHPRAVAEAEMLDERGLRPAAGTGE